MWNVVLWPTPTLAFGQSLRTIVIKQEGTKFHLAAPSIINYVFPFFVNKFFSYGSRINATAGYVYVLRPNTEMWTRALLRRTQIIYTPDSALIMMLLDVKPGSVRYFTHHQFWGLLLHYITVEVLLKNYRLFVNVARGVDRFRMLWQWQLHLQDIFTRMTLKNREWSKSNLS